MTGPSAPSRARVLLVSLGSTAGLRRADDALADGLRQAGVEVTLARARAPRAVRTLALTDLAWALAARRATRAALDGAPAPGAIIYSSTTAALLAPARGAVRFDAPAAGNRPGRHGLWQRPLERRRLRAAPLLLPWSDGALDELGPLPGGPRTLVVPVPVEASPVPAPLSERDIAVLAYGANPYKKGLDRVIGAWRALCARGEVEGELLIAGAGERELADAGIEAALPRVRALGSLPRAEYRGLSRRARVFACAPRREDYGLAQLEALADGCRLVTTAAPGPYAALPIARELDPRLVGEDIEGALRAALTTPREDYAERAARALERYAPDRVAALVAERLVPLLGEQSR